ncbi:YitT family protein [Kiritimatiellaeota bacterium B1221]|nr:YitT family protein [Kiritimatiellaeota bacterium B1221]
MIQNIKEYLFILCGGIIYAIALKYFVLPSKVILTGTEGVAAALSYYFSNYWVFISLYTVFQLLLLVFAVFKVSRKFALRSFFTVGTIILFLAILPEFHFAQPESQNERIILVLFGGLLAGVAKALAFKSQGSTGDEDILGAYFAMKYLKPVGMIAVFAAVGSTGFGLWMDYLKNGDFEGVVNTLMYTCIYIFASSETLNNLYRKFQLTMFTVITRDHKIIGKAIRDEFDHRTYTVQSGVGGHSAEEFSMVRAIITKEELPGLIHAVEERDPDCFYYHHDIEGVSKRYYITPIG